MEDEVPRAILADIVKRSCDAFRVEEVTPLVKVDGHYVLVSYSFVLRIIYLQNGSHECLLIHLHNILQSPIHTRRNYSTDQPSPSKTWHSKCSATSSNTSSPPDPTTVDSQSWAPPPETRDPPPSTVYAVKRAWIASSYSPRDVSVKFKRGK